MSITATTLTTTLDLTEFTTDVEIFTSTKARDIPSKIDAIAVDLKENVNINNAAMVDYMNNDVLSHVNSEMELITTDYNTIMNNMINNMGMYVSSQDVGYSVAQTNSLIWSGPGTVTYDANGNVTEAVEGPKTTKNIVYDTDGNLTSFTEELLVDGVTYTKSFTVSYDANGNITGTVEV